ncbi:unnamed protein product, partial [Rotaria sp. Silwood1]
MPITNISITPSTNIVMNNPQTSLSHEIRQQQTDLSICKPPSSTLVDLLNQRRSPPPPMPPVTTSQRKQNSIIKQPRKSSKKYQIQ